MDAQSVEGCRSAGSRQTPAEASSLSACGLRALRRLATRSQTLGKQICTLHGMSGVCRFIIVEVCSWPRASSVKASSLSGSRPQTRGRTGPTRGAGINFFVTQMSQLLMQRAAYADGRSTADRASAGCVRSGCTALLQARDTNESSFTAVPVPGCGVAGAARARRLSTYTRTRLRLLITKLLSQHSVHRNTTRELCFRDCEAACSSRPVLSHAQTTVSAIAQSSEQNARALHTRSAHARRDNIAESAHPARGGLIKVEQGR